MNNNTNNGIHHQYDDEASLYEAYLRLKYRLEVMGKIAQGPEGEAGPMGPKGVEGVGLRRAEGKYLGQDMIPLEVIDNSTAPYGVQKNDLIMDSDSYLFKALSIEYVEAYDKYMIFVEYLNTSLKGIQGEVGPRGLPGHSSYAPGYGIIIDTEPTEDNPDGTIEVDPAVIVSHLALNSYVDRVYHIPAEDTILELAPKASDTPNTIVKKCVIRSGTYVDPIPISNSASGAESGTLLFLDAYTNTESNGNFSLSDVFKTIFNPSFYDGSQEFVVPRSTVITSSGGIFNNTYLKEGQLIRLTAQFSTSGGLDPLTKRAKTTLILDFKVKWVSDTIEG